MGGKSAATYADACDSFIANFARDNPKRCVFNSTNFNNFEITKFFALPDNAPPASFRHEQASALVQRQHNWLLEARAGPRAVGRARLGAARQRGHLPPHNLPQPPVIVR